MPSKERGASLLPKLVADRIGRVFNLVFNRVTMYSLDHPSTRESIQQLNEALKAGLQHVSPLALILDRENIYIEEELLDPRVSVQRLVAHMKNTEVQSISFERGCTEQELASFARIFADPKAYPDAGAMKRGLAQMGTQWIRVNHIFFKKMTADDQVVDKTEGPSGGVSGLTQIVIDAVPEQDRPEAPADADSPRPHQGMPGYQDLFRDLTLRLLVEDPSMVSKQLLDAEGSRQDAPGAPVTADGPIIHGIRELRRRIEEAGADSGETQPTEDLLGAVYQLKDKIRSDIESRKQEGAQVIGEDLIVQEMDELTDQVMIQLVKEEYQEGQISVKRLAQILRRMIPDVRDLRRLLPKLKEALLSEGMPLADYLQLIKELERELRSDELAIALEEGAEEVGLSVEELIREVRQDPGSAANLIVLAAEIRCLGEEEDQDLLTQILIDYVEKVGRGLAFERAQNEGQEGAEHLKQIISQVQDEILGQMQKRLEGSSVVERVQAAVQSKQDVDPVELQQELILHQFLQGQEMKADPQALLQSVERAYSEPSQQEEVLESFVGAMEDRGLDPGPLLEALARRTRVAPGEDDPHKAPRGTFNRTMILFFLREEVKRARRYGHIFSAVLLSVKQARALKPIPIGMIRPHDIRNALMLQIVEYLRDVDLVGCLEENRVLILLPFTGEAGAEAVDRKIMGNLNAQTISVRDVPMQVTLAIGREPFDNEKTPTLKAMLTRLEMDISQALKSEGTSDVR
jgi:hypothetical protein